MEFRNVGSSGLKVSTLGIGCNNFGGRLDETQSIAVIRAALDHGITHFDTADVYPMTSSGVAEQILGKGLGKDRDKVVLASKVGMRMHEDDQLMGGSRRYVMQAVEDGLRRLCTDHIDLLYLHQPDPDTPIDETLAAFDNLIRAGKVRYIGSSNFSAWQIVEAQYIARELPAARFIASQEHYSLVRRDVEKEVVPVCEKYGLGVIPFFPLAGGLLSGKYAQGQAAPAGARLTTSPGHADQFLTDANLETVGQLAQIAGDHGKGLIDLAFSWLLRAPVVPSVIAGASTPEQVARNTKAATWQMPPDVLAEVTNALE